VKVLVITTVQCFQTGEKSHNGHFRTTLYKIT